MKLDDISNKQLIISLSSAVVVLLCITIAQSYLIDNLSRAGDKLLGQFTPMFVTYVQTMNCNDANQLKNYLKDTMNYHGPTAQADNKALIKLIEERCG